MKVSGLTLEQIRNTVTKSVENYLRDPVVKVRLMNFRFTILGEVKREWTVNSFNNNVTLTEAIGLAGGLTDLADRSKIKLIRHSTGEADIIYLNLLDENILSSPYYIIHQNDVLVVPPLRQRPFKTNFGPNFGLVLSAVSTLLLVINVWR